jgi:manganese transport protein
MFTGSKAKMGEFANAPWVSILAWTTALIILVLNLKLLADFFGVTQWLGKL